MTHPGPCLNYEGQPEDEYTPNDSCYLHLIAAVADRRALSKLLFQARENLEMWADVVDARTGRKSARIHGLVAEIDAYRAAHGWSPNGFGGEA